MVSRNPTLRQLEENYLFVEIAKRKSQFPEKELINLGIGDTTEALSRPVIQALEEAVKKLACPKGYSGYESSFGREALRNAISEKIYHGRVLPEEIFISDGSKCDIARLQHLFGIESSIALQDPTYPAYLGSSRIHGKTKIHFISCTPANHFCPDPQTLPPVDLLYLCSPNNPTGHVMNHIQLEAYVEYAKKNRSIIIFDSAYSAFIKNPLLPRSIYEINHSKEVAIETGSFSKSFGFTGVRLGWLVVPRSLTFNDGSFVREDWMKITSTHFNGASNLAQAGGLAALSDEGMLASQEAINHYMENAKLLKAALPMKCYGGENIPYLWVDVEGRDSWKLFDEFLHKYKIVSTPGVGFGPSGEGFLRLSAFAKREMIEKAISIIQRSF